MDPAAVCDGICRTFLPTHLNLQPSAALVGAIWWEEGDSVVTCLAFAQAKNDGAKGRPFPPGPKKMPRKGLQYGPDVRSLGFVAQGSGRTSIGMQTHCIHELWVRFYQGFFGVGRLIRTPTDQSD